MAGSGSSTIFNYNDSWWSVPDDHESPHSVLAMTNSESEVLVRDHGDFVSSQFPDGVMQILSWAI